MENRFVSDRMERRLARLASLRGVSNLKAGWSSVAGDIQGEWATPGARKTHLIASSTKLLAACIVGQLVDEKVLDFNDSLSDYLPRDELVGLNCFGGVDWAGDLSVGHVLSHQSGIPDYYRAKRLPTKGDIASFTSSDPGWNLADTLELSRGMKPRFHPGSGKAIYSGTNYQLVGRLIETVTGLSFVDAVRERLTKPLGLSDTKVITRDHPDPFFEASPVLFGSQPYLGAKRIGSLGAEGAMVSCIGDTVRLTRAWVSGELVRSETRQRMMAGFALLFPSIRYGLGVMELTLPRVFTRAPHRVLYGHAGMTGHVMFHEPHSDIIVVATINQLKPSVIPYRIIGAVLDEVTRHQGG